MNIYILEKISRSIKINICVRCNDVDFFKNIFEVLQSYFLPLFNLRIKRVCFLDFVIIRKRICCSTTDRIVSWEYFFDLSQVELSRQFVNTGVSARCSARTSAHSPAGALARCSTRASARCSAGSSIRYYRSNIASKLEVSVVLARIVSKLLQTTQSAKP